jgi:membrane associated rhomboid family serine protease
MIPLRDDQPRFSTPFVTYFLIAINLVIYYGEFMLSPRDERSLLYQFGLIPAHVVAVITGASHAPVATALVPIFTSMFLHGSWMHVIGNMWFLWIFGDNIEDYLGHFNYLVFYLLSGVSAAMAQVILSPDSRVPTVGASGAIAGVLGAFFLLYPKARVLTWFPLIFFFYLPAWVLLGFWFVMQFVSGTVSSAAEAGQRGGVAFWAHVGGFIAGILLIKVFPERPRRYRYGTW